MFRLKTGKLFWSLKNPTYSNIIPRAKHVPFKLRTLYARLYVFRYIHCICPCYFDKHPLRCEQFSWYQNPDEGYQNWNVQRWLYIKKKKNFNYSVFRLSSYIYIYIYIVLFGPVKPELGVIPSGQENHSGAEQLNFPGRELNVINFTEQYFL